MRAYFLIFISLLLAMPAQASIWSRFCAFVGSRVDPVASVVDQKVAQEKILTALGLSGDPFTQRVERTGQLFEDALKNLPLSQLLPAAGGNYYNAATFGVAPPDPAFVKSLGLNSSGVATLRNGVIIISETSASTSGMGIADKGLPQPGLSELRRKCVNGHCLVKVDTDDVLSRGSRWGGRYGITNRYVLYKGDAADYGKRTREGLVSMIRENLSTTWNDSLFQNLRSHLGEKEMRDYPLTVSSLSQYGFQTGMTHMSGILPRSAHYLPPRGYFYRFKEGQPRVLEIAGDDSKSDQILAEMQAVGGRVLTRESKGPFLYGGGNGFTAEVEFPEAK